MRFFEHDSRTSRSRFMAAPVVGLLLLASLVAVALVSLAGAAAPVVTLGTADSFAILAGRGDHQHGPDDASPVISGTFPTTSITGARLVTVTGAESRRRRGHPAERRAIS